MSPKSRKNSVNDSQGFVDRDETLMELDHYRELVVSGEGMCVFLKGETGVGKTCVAEEFLKYCNKNGFEVLRSRCLYYESTEPYLPFYEALDQYIGEEKEEVEEEAMGPGFIGQATPSSSSDATPMSFIVGEEDDENEVHKDTSLSDQQDMMFNRITDLLVDISKDRPVVFFMDDLQWIDDSSAQLLHHLARNISNERIFLLGAYRPEELLHEEERPPLKDTLDRMKEEKILDIINISRLDQRSVSQLVKNYLQREDLPEEFTWTLYRESEGNPFYVIEILNSMMQDGVIDPHSFKWDPHEELSDITIPTSIKDITSRKIEDLSKEEKKVLMFASLLGTEFNFQILEEVVDMDVIQLLDLIDSLKDQGLIEEVGEDEEELYRFHHLQTKTVLYEEMGRSRKRVSHRKIGEILERIYEDELEEHYFELSRHFFEGKDYKKAYDYSKKAGERALQGLDFSTALDHFQRALKSVRKGKKIDDPDEKGFELLKRIGSLYFDISDFESAKKIYNEMIRRGRKTGDKRIEGRGLMRLGHIYKNMNQSEKGEGYLEQALEICKDLDDLEGIAQCNRGLGYLRGREGEFDDAERYYQEGVEKAKEADSDKELALSYLNLAIVYGQKGEHDKSIEYFKKSLPPLKARNSYRQLARAHNNIGDQYMKKGEMDEAIKYFEKCIEYADRIGNKRFQGWGSFNAAEAYTRKDDTEKASEYIEGVEELMKDIDDKRGLAAVHHKKGMIHHKKGELDKAIERYKKAMNIMEDLEVPFNTAEYRLDLGIVYKEKGDDEIWEDELDKAKYHIEKAYDTFKRIGATEKFVDKAEEALEDLENLRG